MERLPSGSWRVKVYAGTDPLTGREIRLRRTCKTERAAQIELGKLLEQASAGRQPETNSTVAGLMDRYTKVADCDLSTRKANEFYIRRVIKPALGHLQVRKIRGQDVPVTTLQHALAVLADEGLMSSGRAAPQSWPVPSAWSATSGGRRAAATTTAGVRAASRMSVSS